LSDKRKDREGVVNKAGFKIRRNEQLGGVAEWPIASVLKTDMAKAIEGSNPSPSASP
jgi:hypothetical protein